MRKDWVMDYETLINCFIAVFEDVRSEEVEVFVIHKLRNDFIRFIEFLDRNIALGETHVSFNGLAFDAQITHHILVNKEYYYTLEGDDLAFKIYELAQTAISKSNSKNRLDFYESSMSIKQLDVYKINHWDNKNKRTSLKWAEYAMDWFNVLDMPIHHTIYIETLEQIYSIIVYCKNDVKATKKILFLSKPLLEVRNSVLIKYGIKCHNYSNTKLGSELLLKLYCESTGKKTYYVRSLRTIRNGIHVKDILFSYISFRSNILQEFLDSLRTKIIWNTKNDFKYSLSFSGSIFEYGAGGIHQCIAPGAYKADDLFIIRDLDVASLYPSIACVNEMYPAHLGKEFFKVYKESIVDVRLAEKKKGKDGDRAIIEGFKEAANASYGNSNQEHSWLYDPQYTMQTTINGQLLITMLVENLVLDIPGSMLLQTNTDGATLRFPRKFLDKYNEICSTWEKLTKLTLEYVDYSAMYIADVNTYIAVYTDPNKTPKCKGRYEWEDLQNHKYTHLHKNKSFLIISKGVYNYLVRGIIPEETIKNNRNIYDYCAGVKAKGEWEFKEVKLEEGLLVEQPIQKTVRYYISKKGSKIVKTNKSDNRQIQLDSKWYQTVFNLYEEKVWDDYNINESYYLQAIYKEIGNIVDIFQYTQISMF